MGGAAGTKPHDLLRIVKMILIWLFKTMLLFLVLRGSRFRA